MANKTGSAPIAYVLFNLTREYENVILGAMLLLLHLATWWDFAHAMSASLMLAHLGLFLLWQPIWRGDQRLDLTGGLVFLVFTLGFVGTLNWWSLSCWLILLIGMVGGRSLTGSAERYAYMLTLFFLVSELLIGAVPQLFYAQGLSATVVGLFKYGLLAVPAVLTVIPHAVPTGRTRPAVDLFRGVTSSLMTALVALGSLVTMYRTDAGYAEALFQSLFVLAAILFGVSWLLTPRAVAGGLAQLWERSLLNIGTPFEEWLTELARIAEQQQTPEQFLEAAMRELVRLHWVRGAEWRADDATGLLGTPTRYPIDVSAAGLDVRICTDLSAGPTLVLHAKLLVQLIGHFYVAKTREQELAKQAHLQAIHETGARVTHDIKNLLQSLQAITMVLLQDRQNVVGPERRRQDARGQQLLEKQLPVITQRLQLALDKLQAPDRAVSEEKPLSEWWEMLQARNQGGDVDFSGDIGIDPRIAADLFDSVAENLLENARHKKMLEPALRTRVALRANGKEISLRVSDDGRAVPAGKAEQLFRQPVSSATGLGIGLYQAARQAEVTGYSLRLISNEDGNVCFELARGCEGADGHEQYSLFTPA